MRVLSLGEAASLVGATDISAFFEGGGWQYPDPVPSYAIPKDSGGKVHLARILAGAFLDHGPALLWIVGWGVWPSAEHMDLFTGYRRSTEDTRALEDAPLHLFEERDMDAFISVLALGLLFLWDLEIVALNRSLGATISHDEWFELRAASGRQALIPRVEGFVRRP